MRAFDLTVPTINPSYENAIQAGSLSHTGNSNRPIAAPVKVVTGRLANAVQPPSYNGPVVPRANPVQRVAPFSGLITSTISVPRAVVPVSNPILHAPAIRGILGQ